MSSTNYKTFVLLTHYDVFNIDNGHLKKLKPPNYYLLSVNALCLSIIFFIVECLILIEHDILVNFTSGKHVREMYIPLYPWPLLLGYGGICICFPCMSSWFTCLSSETGNYGIICFDIQCNGNTSCEYKFALSTALYLYFPGASDIVWKPINRV